MFRNDLAFKRMCTIILFITMGISQTPVSLAITNMNTTAGTLDITMTNTAGCEHCDDPRYNTKTLCEANGWNNGTGIWKFDANIDQATCESSTTNGYYFAGGVAAFQFYLTGLTVTGVSGGTGEEYLDFVQYSTTGSGKILGTAFGANVIPVGTDALLTTVSYSAATESICFAENIVIEAERKISDTDANPVDTDWGTCYCSSGEDLGCGCGLPASDCAGVCGGSAVISGCDNACNSTAVEDCAGECGGSATDYNGDGVGCGEMAISQIGSNLPEEFSISQNFPNPFNPITSITFDVAKMDAVSLVVYDLTGKEVVTLVSGTYIPGTYNVEWNAVNNAGDGIVSGMYIYRYISSEKAITRKMLYLK